MRTRLLIIFFFIACAASYGQEVRWADHVLEFSSEFGKRQYSANQVLGKPNVLPNLGASPNAWAPKKKGKYRICQSGF
jgi:OmpA-OmpF porin, OOP family